MACNRCKLLGLMAKKRKSSKKSSRRRRIGAVKSGSIVSTGMNMLMTGLQIGAGYLAADMADKYLTNKYLNLGAKAAGSLFLLMGKNPTLKTIGAGVATNAVLSLPKTFGITVPIVDNSKLPGIAGFNPGFPRVGEAMYANEPLININ